MASRSKTILDLYTKKGSPFLFLTREANSAGLFPTKYD